MLVLPGASQEFPALISYNTRSAQGGELPYRVTWFMPPKLGASNSTPHLDITEKEAHYLSHGVMPASVRARLIARARELFKPIDGTSPMFVPRQTMSHTENLKRWAAELAALSENFPPVGVKRSATRKCTCTCKRCKRCRKGTRK
jgi:hypothetical protein